MDLYGARFFRWYFPKNELSVLDNKFSLQRLSLICFLSYIHLTLFSQFLQQHMRNSPSNNQQCTRYFSGGKQQSEKHGEEGHAEPGTKPATGSGRSQEETMLAMFPDLFDEQPLRSGHCLHPSFSAFFMCFVLWVLGVKKPGNKVVFVKFGNGMN
jgi:hypothetical protein